MKFYVLVLSGGVEIEKSGPFTDAGLQLAEAKRLWSELDPMKGDNVFWLDVSSTDVVFVGAFVEGQLDEENVG